MKKIFVVWISIYPAITVILLLFGDELSIMPIFIRTLVLTIVLVPLMVCLLIPFWSKVFNFAGESTFEKREKSR